MPYRDLLPRDPANVAALRFHAEICNDCPGNPQKSGPRLVLFGRELDRGDLEREAEWLREAGYSYAASLMEKLWDDLHEAGAGAE